MLEPGTSWTGNDKPTPFDYAKAMKAMAAEKIKRVPCTFRLSRVGVEIIKRVFASPLFPFPEGVPHSVHGIRIKLDEFVPDWVCEALDQRGKLMEVTHLEAGCSVPVGGEYL